MLRSATIATVLTAAAVITGCGTDASTDESPTSSRPQQKRQTQPSQAEPGGGLTQAQFGALQLRTPRDRVLEAAGQPARRTTEGGSECLEYRALDAGGAAVENQVYKLCFNQRGQLAVLTATPTFK